MDFVKIFGYERFHFEHKGILFIGFPTGPMMRMALGHVAPEDIVYAREVLEKNGKAGNPVFMVTHMPMQPTDVDNWYEVTEAIRPPPTSLRSSTSRWLASSVSMTTRISRIGNHALNSCVRR